MGKIRLNNGQELEIIADGIRATGDYLTLGLVPGDKNIMEYETLLSEAANTSKIQVIDYNDEVFKIYSGYTKMQKIEKQMETVVDYTQDEEGNPVPVNGVAILVELKKPDKTEARIAALEETVDKLVLDSLGIA
ncbi:hypothetical protein [Blautia producta]|uniref:Uncharacterized protein n=3 Tax=Blautia producta TaxID=33035 RepID=A0A7G5N2U4_9FIRM|nr:hypothetical protein [Blautia producta]QIB56079.1 hypothetical protein GXM18_15120 [Blautia producta ATCC 27340 = DSM 2950]QMW81187.1 hypothetical protein E5259_28480 [Blautia producta]